MKNVFLGLILVIIVPAVSIGGTESIVLNGIPLTQSKSNIQESQNYQLSESQQNEYRLLITKIGENYFWKTRENRPLFKHQSGDITIFIEMGGAGYIRISKVEGRFFYMEHMAHGFQSVTYWGITENFTP